MWKIKKDNEIKKISEIELSEIGLSEIGLSEIGLREIGHLCKFKKKQYLPNRYLRAITYPRIQIREVNLRSNTISSGTSVSAPLKVKMRIL